MGLMDIFNASKIKEENNRLKAENAQLIQRMNALGVTQYEQTKNKLIGLSGILSAYKAGCKNTFEIAEHLDVTEDFFQEALSCYRQKYGTYATIDNYVIFFEPSIGVLEMI